MQQGRPKHQNVVVADTAGVDALEDLLFAAAAKLHTIKEEKTPSLLTNLESLLQEAHVVLAAPVAQHVGASALARAAAAVVGAAR